MRRYITLLFFVLVACLAQTSQARKVALLVGVDSYVSVPSLKCCVNDMKALKEALMKIGFEEDDIRILVTGASDSKDLPTKRNIEKTISQILTNAQPTDMVLLAFSGHGAQDGKSVYFCPLEVELEDLDGTYVSINKVMDILANKCSAKFKWMVVDACRSDPTQGPKGIGGKGLQVIQTPPAGIALFQSCAEGEQSWEDYDSGKGFFTKNFAAEAQKAMDEENYKLAIQKYDEAIALCPRFEHWKRERKLAQRLLHPTPPTVTPAPNTPAPAPVRTLTEPNAGDRKVETINGVEFAFRWCPAGTFTMGSPTSEEDHSSDKTQHKVTLTKGFWMMETEVTQKQWKAVMGDNPTRYDIGDNRPVTHVSWNDCQEFCRKTGLQLPTEAQWEYACRAGSTGAYAGNLDDMAWYENNSGSRTHSVGTKKPNAWGLYDMHGNVYEWCQDWFGKYPSGSVTDPTGPSSGSDRVGRGGSWDDDAGGCRSAYRSYGEPGYRYYYLGFRVLRGQ